ncbi:ATP-binding protein [Anabaena cylindrica UHCC 0172]|uniref:ATP-binding protein n=1 Tax=Anabaena cylindrica TaxID=1165 RepID=UPI002B20B050|nr:ATP-binding protein [Anabaena cylindrica]MEA5553853.1 ATP-binding protein [Anabaena cylindrica UHCC 0172]
MSDINWGLIRSGSTFENLICSLILLEDHEARLYVRPGKDFAQDARSGDGLTIYQMKFHQNESTSSAITDAKKEAEQIAKYLKTPGKSQEVWQGVKKWILVSNVAFNSNNELRWNKEIKPLFGCLGLEASYWEKSQIETRLHKYPDLKQAYFEEETRVFLGIAEALEQIKKFQEFNHPHAINATYQGRTKELELFRNFINDADKKILVIHGAGGIGKTRFLLEGAKTQALPEGWQVLWANVSTMTTNSSWSRGLIPERRTLVLIDEPDDETVLKTLIEQIFGGRSKTWKVAIAVRSFNDLVLKYVKESGIRPMVEKLQLSALEKSEAVTFCQELLESGSLQTQTADWKTQAATWIAQHYDYPIWMAIAIKLLESKGNLETMPQEVKGLASEYLEKIITQKQNIPQEQIKNLLHWIALFNTINRKDTAVMDWIKTKVGCRNSTELKKLLDKLIDCNVIFERGAYNRLLKIKPDVLADYILQDWLIYQTRRGDNEASDEALEIVAEISTMLENYTEVLSIPKLLLNSIAKFELNQQLQCNNHINILKELLDNWHEKIPKMNARQKLVYLSLLDEISEISFAHVSEVLNILRAILNSNSESEVVSTIFGQRIIDHDDVILALPWIIYHTAITAQTSKYHKTILLLLCDLVIKEHDIVNRRPQGFPNDGKRAVIVLPKIITGGSAFISNFEKSALTIANTILENIRSTGNINQDHKLQLNVLCKALLSVEKQDTRFNGRNIIIQRWIITPDQAEWTIRDSLRSKIIEILSERKIPSNQSLIFWDLLVELHREINRAISYSEEFRNVLIQDLQWVLNFLNTYKSINIQELSAARKIWDWHYQFDPDPELKKIATDCENFFQDNQLFPDYAPLLSREGYKHEVREQWANGISQKLVNPNNSQSIHEFIQNGIQFLGNPNQISRLFIVAAKLGEKAEQSEVIHEFLEQALTLSIENPEFQFATILCRHWVKYSELTKVFEKILQWTNNNTEKIVNLIQAIYETTWDSVSDTEVNILLEQKNNFLQTNSSVRFLGLLGCIFFSPCQDKIKNTVENIFNELDHQQLSNGLATFLESLDYAIHSSNNKTNNVNNPSLIYWILDQVLRLPDIDNLSGTTIHHLQELLEILGKPNLEWLLNAIQTRLKMSSGSDSSTKIRILPSRERLSQWIIPISSEQGDDTRIRNILTNLLSYIDSFPMLVYSLPQYLFEIDPNGVFTSDLVIEKLRDSKIRENTQEVYRWSKFAGYYSEESPTWRKIAHEVCSLAVHFDDSDKYLILQALTNPKPKTWMSSIGTVAAIFEVEVETAEQKLETENDSVLKPYWEWRLQLAQVELERQTELVKEEIEE